MSNTFVVARRELAEKRFVIVAAIAFALLSLVIPMAVHGRDSFGEALLFSSTILATAFTLGVSGILGATVVGRELSESRLSFYFARPLSATAIWFGKALAATTLIVVSFAIIFTPAIATGRRITSQWTGNVWAFGGIVVLAAVVLFLVVHVLGTMVRSHSAWIALDFLCLVATIAALNAMLRLPFIAGALTVMETSVGIFGIGFLLVLVAASAWQLARGRTDRLGNHLALSRFLWSGVTAVLVIGAAYLLWALSVSPSDLEYLGGYSGRGGWVVIEGHAMRRGDYYPSFLVNRDGRTMRILVPSAFGVNFSKDAGTAVWLRPDSITSSSLEIVRCRLDVPHPHAERTGIATPFAPIALSEDGARVVAGQSNFTVFDVASGRSLGSFHIDIPMKRWARSQFLDRDTVRVYAGSEIYEFHIASRSLQHTGSFDGLPQSLSPDHSRLIVFREHQHQLTDARSGAVLASLGGDHGFSAAFLCDGSIMSADVSPTGMTLHHFNAAGALLRDVNLPGYFGVSFAGGDSHRVVLRLRPGSSFTSSIAVLDLDRGVIVREEPTLTNAIIDNARPLPDELLATTRTAVVAWNPVTGSKRLVTGR